MAMRLLWLSLAILVLGSAPATAQNSHGYLFAAPGGVSVAEVLNPVTWFRVDKRWDRLGDPVP